MQIKCLLGSGRWLLQPIGVYLWVLVFVRTLVSSQVVYGFFCSSATHACVCVPASASMCVCVGAQVAMSDDQDATRCGSSNGACGKLYNPGQYGALALHTPIWTHARY